MVAHACLVEPVRVPHQFGRLAAIHSSLLSARLKGACRLLYLDHDIVTPSRNFAAVGGGAVHKNLLPYAIAGDPVLIDCLWLDRTDDMRGPTLAFRKVKRAELFNLLNPVD